MPLTDQDEPVMWMNKRIDDLTRDEAIAALKTSCRLHRQSQRETERQFAVLDQARKLRV